MKYYYLFREKLFFLFFELLKYFRMVYFVRMIGEELQKKYVDKIINEEIFCLEVVGFCYDLGQFM